MRAAFCGVNDVDVAFKVFIKTVIILDGNLYFHSPFRFLDKNRIMKRNFIAVDGFYERRYSAFEIILSLFIAPFIIKMKIQLWYKIGSFLDLFFDDCKVALYTLLKNIHI